MLANFQDVLASVDDDTHPFFKYELHVGIDGAKEPKWSREITEITIHSYNPNPCFDPIKIISHDPATIIIWRDGTKTVVKCQNGEPYDLEKGIAMCYMKKVNGNKPKYYDIFKTAKKKGVLKDD